MRKRSSRRPIRRLRRVVLRSKFRFERRRKVKQFTKYVFVLGLVLTVSWWSWKSVYGFLLNFDGFKIKDIEISRTKNISRSEIIALLPFQVGDNIFKLWLFDTEKKFRELKPELKDIKVTRHWQKITIKFDERTPMACINLNGQKLGVDEENKVFPLRGNWLKQFLPEIIAENAAERKDVLEFAKMFKDEGTEFFACISRLYPEPVNNVVIELKDRLKIYWGTSDRNKIKKKLERIDQVLKDAGSRFAGLEYVDLSYFEDGRILVKPLKPLN